MLQAEATAPHDELAGRSEQVASHRREARARGRREVLQRRTMGPVSWQLLARIRIPAHIDRGEGFLE